MYGRSAQLYDLLYHFKDYAGEARQLRELVDREAPHARTLLDAACGTGRHLEHLRATLDVEGVDSNPVLLEAARRRCPGVPFHERDIVTLDLGRTYDVVSCLFSSIACVGSRARMGQAVGSLARHVAPGGLLVVEPWFSPERYRVGTVTVNTAQDGDRRLVWMYSSTREGDVSVLDIHYLLGSPSGVEHFHDRQELGLFTDEQYAAAFGAAGLDVRHDPEGLRGRGLFVGRRP